MAIINSMIDKTKTAVNTNRFLLIFILGLLCATMLFSLQQLTLLLRHDVKCL